MDAKKVDQGEVDADAAKRVQVVDAGVVSARARLQQFSQDRYLVDQLVRARHVAGLSQREVAHLMRVRQSMVSRIERGVYVDSLDLLSAYANAVGARIIHTVVTQ